MRAFSLSEQRKWDKQIEIFEKNCGTRYFGQPERSDGKVGKFSGKPEKIAAKPERSFGKTEGTSGDPEKTSGRTKVRDLKEKKRIKVLINAT